MHVRCGMRRAPARAQRRCLTDSIRATLTRPPSDSPITAAQPCGRPVTCSARSARSRPRARVIRPSPCREVLQTPLASVIADEQLSRVGNNLTMGHQHRQVAHDLLQQHLASRHAHVGELLRAQHETHACPTSPGEQAHHTLGRDRRELVDRHERRPRTALECRDHRLQVSHDRRSEHLGQQRPLVGLQVEIHHRPCFRRLQQVQARCAGVSGSSHGPMSDSAMIARRSRTPARSLCWRVVSESR